jgi:hypothetical protein
MKTILQILGLSVVHLIFQFFSFFGAMLLGLQRFGSTDPVSIPEGFLHLISTILMFPIATPLMKSWPYHTGFPLEYVPFMINSLLWGTVLVLTWKWKRSSR